YKNLIASREFVEYSLVSYSQSVICGNLAIRKKDSKNRTNGILGVLAMWKSSKDEKPLPTAPPSPALVPPANADMKKEFRPMEIKQPDKFSNDVAHIGKSVLVKGE